MAPTDPHRWQADASEFIEQLGFLTEAAGHPRIAGRVLGFLLVCDPKEQSAQDICEALSVSRSAVSTTTRQLGTRGFVERVAVPGQRECRYRIAEDGMVRMQRESLAGISALRRLTERALGSLSWRPPDVNLRLQCAHDTHAFLERELPALFERLEQEVLLKVK
jgi:DNA-binding MarR family transcriptional regulator